MARKHNSVSNTEKRHTFVALRMLKSLPDADKGVGICLLTDKGIHHICESVNNTIFGRHSFSKNKKSKLRRLGKQNPKFLRKVTDKEVPVSIKRKLLKQQKGGFLSAILAVALPLLGEIISQAVRK